MSSKPFLTVLIPTIGRLAHLKKCLDHFIVSRAAYSGNLLVEILVADNCSTDGTDAYVLALCQQYAYVRYFKHETFRKSAEESILHSLPQCFGEYIWTFGDDDYVGTTAITEVLNCLNFQMPSLLFINNHCLDDRTGRVVLNFPVQHTSAVYSEGQHFFREWGFTGGPTCVSSMCLRRDIIDLGLFYEISNVSTIYSLSWFLFCSFYNKKIVLLGKPLFTYRFNETHAEVAGIKRVAKDSGELPNFFWHLGLIKLANFAADYTRISLHEIVSCHEVMTSGLDNERAPLRRIFVPFVLFVTSSGNADLPRCFSDFCKNPESIYRFLRELESFYMLIGGHFFDAKYHYRITHFLKAYARLAACLVASDGRVFRKVACGLGYMWHRIKYRQSFYDLVAMALKASPDVCFIQKELS